MKVATVFGISIDNVDWPDKIQTLCKVVLFVFEDLRRELVGFFFILVKLLTIMITIYIFFSFLQFRWILDCGRYLSRALKEWKNTTEINLSTHLIQQYISHIKITFRCNMSCRLQNKMLYWTDRRHDRHQVIIIKFGNQYLQYIHQISYPSSHNLLSLFS